MSMLDEYVDQAVHRFGGNPAILSLQFPRKLLGKTYTDEGFTEFAIPSELWKHVVNPKIQHPRTYFGNAWPVDHVAGQTWRPTSYQYRGPLNETEKADLAWRMRLRARLEARRGVG